MSSDQQKLWLYNTILVLAYLFAAAFLLAVRGTGIKVLAVLALPAPLILWCLYKNLIRDRLFILYLFVFSIVATPDVRVPGLPALRAEQGILFAILAWCIYCLLTGKKLKFHTSLFTGMFAGFGLVMLLSTYFGVIVGVGSSYSDIFELYKIVVYLGIFIVFATITRSEDDRWQVVGFANLCIALSGLIAITQYFNPMRINEFYVPRIAPTQFITLVNSYFSPRVIGLSNNPNVYAVIAAVGVLFSLILLFRTRRLHHVLFGSINMLALLMTKSRTGLVFLGVMFAVLYLIYFFEKVLVNRKVRLRSLTQMLSILMVLLIAAPIAFFLLPDTLVWRFKDFTDITSATSWQARMVHWQENIEYFYKSPILGIGAAKSVNFRFAPDNEWLLLLRKFGMLGTAWFVMMFAVPVYMYWPGLKKNMMAKIYVAVLVGLAVYMCPAAPFHSFQIMPLVMLIGGLAFSSLKEKYSILTLSTKEVKEVDQGELSGC
jgi:hypothetical protein